MHKKTMKREEAIIETFQKKKQIGPKGARNTSEGRRNIQGFRTEIIWLFLLYTLSTSGLICLKAMMFEKLALVT